MRYIELSARNWKTVLDFYCDVLAALGAPEWHSKSINGMVDSMVWGGINTVHPPYIVRIRGMKRLPEAVRREIEILEKEIAKQRTVHLRRHKKDVEVEFELMP